MATKAKKYNGLVRLIERIAAEMYSDAEWKKAETEAETSIGMTYNFMLSDVYRAAYEKDPDSFDGVNWVNCENGLPVWVRPGVNWQPST